MALTRDRAESLIIDFQDKLFEKVSGLAGDEQRPSDIAKLLDQASWGLGDDYRSWYEEGDEDWS